MQIGYVLPQIDGLLQDIVFGGNLVTWRSKKQTIVARSSVEADYKVMTHTASELMLLQHFLQEIGFSAPTPIPLFCDN
jgi:hypothetical protein